MNAIYVHEGGHLPLALNQSRQGISCTLTMKYWKVSPLLSTNW